MSRFALSPEARSDLRSIREYIAEDRPQRAARVLAELLAACRRAARHPNAFPIALVTGDRYRKIVHKPYVIFYSVRPNSIRIERIVHSARDLPALFGGD